VSRWMVAAAPPLLTPRRRGTESGLQASSSALRPDLHIQLVGAASIRSASAANPSTVGRFDVAVKQPLPVRVIKSAGDRGDDTSNFLIRHASRVSLSQKAGRVETVDEVHGDPQLAVFFSTVVHSDDVGMPERRSEIGFPVEAGPIFGVGRPIMWEQLQRITARKPWVLCELDLAHPPGPQQANDSVPGKSLAASYFDLKKSGRGGP